jgi:phage tail protein X
MFGKLSRYRLVPDIAVPDAGGRVVAAKDIRPLPDVTGTFRHRVVAGDRLDQLAYRYYEEPLLYWQICDANPELLSPLALVDAQPVTTTRFPVTATGVPPWAAALRTLATTVGVEDAAVVEEVVLEPQRQIVGGQPVTVFVERPSRALLVTYNRLSVATGAVAAAIRAAGFQVGRPSDAGQLGQEIVIPPSAIG